MAEPAVRAPERTCRICRTKRPKAELTRWVWQAQWVEDTRQNLPGRGSYSCSPECAAKLIKTKPKLNFIKR